MQTNLLLPSAGEEQWIVHDVQNEENIYEWEIKI